MSLDVEGFYVLTMVDGCGNQSPCPNFDVVATSLTINYTFILNEICFKSQFINVDDKELDNVNKGSHKANKHVKLWAKNVFDEWRKFWGYNLEKSIIDLFESENIFQVSC